MRGPQDQLARYITRLTMDLAVAEAMSASRLEPHKVFYVAAVCCPGCHRHAVGFQIAVPSIPSEGPPKYTLATVVNGEVIGRLMRQQRH